MLFISTVIIFASAILYSCTAPKYIYTPPTANLLGINERKQIKAAADYTTSGSSIRTGNSGPHASGIDAQVVYGASGRLVLRADWFSKWESNQSAGELNNIPFEKVSYRKNGAALSAGIYNFSKNKKASVFQINAGIGTGSSSFVNRYADPDILPQFYKVNYYRFFIQPAAVVRLSSHYNVSIAGRFSIFNYRNINTDSRELKESVLGIIDSKPSLISDVIFQNEFGFKGLTGISFQVQMGTSIVHTSFSGTSSNSFIREKYDYNKLWLAIGAVAGIKALFKKH